MSPAALRWQSDRRAERKAAGLCVDCGEACWPFRRCPDCRRAMNVKRNAANARRRAEALPDVPAPLPALEDLGPLADAPARVACWGCECSVPVHKGEHEEETDIPGMVYAYPCTRAA